MWKGDRIPDTLQERIKITKFIPLNFATDIRNKKKISVLYLLDCVYLTRGRHTDAEQGKSGE
jgi:hypothetical protein